MNRAFLIGAGATRAQYPSSPLSNDFFKLLQDKNNEIYKHLRDIVEPKLGTSLRELNVEKVMILSNKFPQSHKTAFFESLYLAIYELLAKSTFSREIDIENSMKEENRKPPTLFKTLLTDFRLNENDFFMTLNYDLYLDREIMSIKKRIDYGIHANYFHPSTNKFPLSKEQIFSLYHLHGSLNWRINQNKIQLNIGVILPYYLRQGSTLCLIPPGQKGFNDILKTVWKTAEQRLMESDELIIIGCSLNPDDAELIALIKKFIEKRDKKIKIIFLTSQDNQIFSYIPENYRKNFTTNNVKFFPYGFSLDSIEFIFS